MHPAQTAGLTALTDTEDVLEISQGPISASRITLRKRCMQIRSRLPLGLAIAGLRPTTFRARGMREMRTRVRQSRIVLRASSGTIS